MDRVPLEIWIFIISMTHKGDQLALTTTSKSFHAIAQAALYRYVTIYSDSDQWNCLESTLSEKPPLSALVQTFYMEYREPRSVWDSPFQVVDHSWLSYFDTFTKLRELALTRIEIDASFYTSLHALSLSCLMKISLDNCIIWNTTEEVSPTASDDFAPQEVTLRDSVCRGPLPPIVSARLGCLTIRDDKQGTILSTYLLSGVTHTLKALESDANSEVLLQFLESSPQLRKLELWLDKPPRGELSPNAIPSLEVVICPGDWAGMLVKGRPVRRVELCISRAAPFDILQHLQHSTVAVTNCRLWYPDHPQMEIILGNLPLTLCHFAWNSYTLISEAELESWMSALQYLPTLRSLESRTWAHNKYQVTLTDAQETLVDMASGFLPSLQEFSFRDGLFHDYHRWLRRRDSSWEPYICI